MHFDLIPNFKNPVKVSLMYTLMDVILFDTSCSFLGKVTVYKCCFLTLVYFPSP